MGQSFTGRPFSDDESLPLRVSPYLMSSPRTSKGAVLPGLEVSVVAGAWTTLRFRIVNTDLCKGSVVGPHCNPRCVTATVNPAHAGRGAFLYDCEVGFYADEAGMTASTSGHTYRVDACLTEEAGEEVCGSFLIRMPETREIATTGSSGLILLDNVALYHHMLKLHLGGGELNSSSQVQLHLHNSTGRVVVANFPLEGATDVASFPLEDIDVFNSGLYQVEVVTGDDESGVVVASFELVPDEEELKSASIWVTIGLVSFTLVSLVVYFRYLWVRKINRVDPNKLYQDETSKAPRLLVMTDVENRQHVDIVLKLNAYLKDNCCVSEVYFAMDPLTGISTQAEGDPWRWCQEAAAKVSQSPNGFVLILGSPPPKMSLDIYKDFTDNQAYVSTQMLREMDGKSGVRVALLPYSTPDSLPAVIPDHLKKGALSLPEDFNQLVCDLHRISKRPLVPCLPIKFIQPEVCSGNLSKAPAGKDILSSVNALREKVDLFNQQSDSLYVGGTEEDEKVAMLDPSALDTKAQKAKRPKKAKSADGGGGTEEETRPIHVNIEANVMSLNSDYLDKRDKSDLTEEC